VRFPPSWRKAGLLLAALVSLHLGGCATAVGASPASDAAGTAVSKASGNPSDPWERHNRAIFAFNDRLDENFLLPLAKAYREWVPRPIVQGFDNVLANVGDVWSAANHLLQGKPVEALESGLRFGVNTVFGLVGVWDIASEMGIERRTEDFGQTLGVWGVAPGAYLVLPVLGPSSVRDGLAMPLDRAASFTSVANTNGGTTASLALVEAVHTRASLLGATSLLGQVALDRYSFVRDSYLARRRSAIFDGNPPPEPEDEEPSGKGTVQKRQ
jgi:phospholipid-binding lipoprotein MlaA